MMWEPSMGPASWQGLDGSETVWSGDQGAFGVPQRCGFLWWELDHIGGNWVASEVPQGQGYHQL